MPSKRAAYHDKTEVVQNRLFRSLRVWSMYADLEESLGTIEVGGGQLHQINSVFIWDVNG